MRSRYSESILSGLVWLELQINKKASPLGDSLFAWE